jgi:alpha-ribazole phosphatase
MQDIYLIRHTTPAVARGVCYGQTDLDVTESFEEEAEAIRQCLPATIRAVYSSPLQRCTRLAKALFPHLSLQLRDHLMEIDCGQWEMRTWDELPKEEIDPWMADFVNIRIPGGESYLHLHQRVTRCWEDIVAEAGRTPGAAGMPGAAATPAGGRTPGAAGMPSGDSGGALAVVAHGGVIRSILSGITQTPLIDSFKVFSLHYACVIRIQRSAGGLTHSILFNRAPAEKEQHKPSNFYNKSNI